MKAREGDYQKPPGEDLLSLVRGLGGQKGRVVLRLGEVLGDDFSSPEEISAESDRQVVSNLELFPVNYWAVTKLEETEYRELAKREQIDVSKKEAMAFTARLKTCPVPDRQYWLKMYANPVLNRDRVLRGASVG